MHEPLLVWHGIALWASMALLRVAVRIVFVWFNKRLLARAVEQHSKGGFVRDERFH